MSRIRLPESDSPIAVIARHQGRVPVRLDAIANQLGLAVQRVPMGAGISGSIRHDPDCGSPSGFVIEIDSEEPSIRQRFTLAHEIAHYILHRDVIRNGIKVIDSAMYRSRLSSDYESQANRLAADILMPRNRVLEAWGADKDAASLAQTFEVSKGAIEIRLKHLGLV